MDEAQDNGHGVDVETNLDMMYYLFRSYMTGARRMFQGLDTDNDGHITEEELKSVFNDDFDAKAFIAEFDSDGDNKISLKEFISVLTQDLMEEDENDAEDSGDHMTDMTRSAFLLCQRGLKKYFKLHDANGDGQISAEELQSFLSEMGDRMTDQEAKEEIAEVDLDKDGQINFKEFVIAILDDFYEDVLDEEEAEAFDEEEAVQTQDRREDLQDRREAVQGLREDVQDLMEDVQDLMEDLWLQLYKIK